ncbi:uncharacterized protein LOC134690749 [Mytilus trossulus]|uniref:uncharacterized protein LOC134690749 n=1 Tax=Mytilus trossulus TaxID=6551 RepID=UPI0030045EA8
MDWSLYNLQWKIICRYAMSTEICLYKIVHLSCSNYKIDYLYLCSSDRNTKQDFPGIYRSLVKIEEKINEITKIVKRFTTKQHSAIVMMVKQDLVPTTQLRKHERQECLQNRGDYFYCT